MNKESLILGLDFDGSCVQHNYPYMGKDIGAVPVLKRLVGEGHRLMLWTMRSRTPFKGVDTLQEAIDWFKQNHIPLWAINENPEQKKSGWSTSNKQHAHVFIDDAAMGCPLVDGHIDWMRMEELLEEKGILTNKTKI